MVIFNQNLGRIAEQYLRKGAKVYLEGQVQTRKWTDQSGQERYTTEVVLQRYRGELTMLDSRGGGEAAGASTDSRRGRERSPGGSRRRDPVLKPSTPWAIERARLALNLVICSNCFLLIRGTLPVGMYVLNMFCTVMGFKVASRVRGLSDEAFGEAFGTKEQCRAALVRLRWPGGFVCPWCGHREHCVLAGRGLYQCNRCKKQTSPTAGTIFHATKLPLTHWFAAIHLIVTAKNGISSVELGRRLGVKQPTAWAVKHKIMAVMARREGETALTGRVEMDDAYLGGVRSGGKRGRGAAGKTPFVAAVSTSPEGRPRKLKLAPVKGFRKREIARGAKHWLAPGAAVVTDGLGCWSALKEAACSHQAIRTGSGRQAARMASFQIGEHDARQHQERDHRDLSQARPRPCRTLSRQLRLALQPALSTPDNDPAFRP